MSKARDSTHNERNKGRIVVLLGLFAEQTDFSSSPKGEALNWQFC